MIEILCVLSLFISLLVLFIFIIFIKNTREKIIKLSEELQKYNVSIEQSLNGLVRDININNNNLHSHNLENTQDELVLGGASGGGASGGSGYGGASGGGYGGASGGGGREVQERRGGQEGGGEDKKRGGEVQGRRQR